MKILLIGGSRFIGRHLAQQAQAAGHEVILFNRGQSWPDAPFQQIQGNLNQITEYKQTLLDLAPDAVLHCLAMTPQHAHDFVSVFADSSARLSLLSSADCYAAFQDLVKGREQSDWPLNEHDPVTEIPYYWRSIDSLHNVDYDKNQVTEIVQAACPQATVYRLPMVYGPHDQQYAYRHGWILQHIRLQQDKVVLGLNKQASLWHYGYVENIAAALLHGMTEIGNESAHAGKIYNLAEKRVRSWRRWVELFYAAAEQKLEVLTMPDDWLEKDDTTAAQVPQHLLLDSSAFALDTDFVAPIGIEQAIQRTLAWGLQEPDQLGPVPDFAGRHLAWESYLAARNRYHDTIAHEN